MFKAKRFAPVLILLVMLVSSTSMVSQISSAKVMNFIPILQVSVDNSKLNDPIQPDGPAVSIPVQVKYMVNIPGVFNFLPPLIRNTIIYGSMIVPPMKIHLSIENKPDWMNVAIANPDLYIDIKENEFSYGNTSITISVYKDAPARPYTLKLVATSDEMGRVSAQSVEIQSITVTPGYIPLITVNTDMPIKEAGPATTLNFPIRIVNHANKETIVKLVEFDTPSGWAVNPSQREVIIPPDKEATITISVTTPIGFGFAPNQIQQINMKFIALPSPPPLHYEETLSNTYRYSIQVRSATASAAGIIIGILIVVVIVIALIVMLVRKKISS